MRFIGGCVGKLTKEKRNWMIGSTIIVIIFTAVTAFLYWLLFWTGSTKPIETVAAKFKPSPAWTLKSEHTEPPRALCIDVSCPHIVRTWTAESYVSKSEIEDALENAGWSAESGRPCSDIDSTFWIACYFYIKDSGHDVTLSVSNSKSDGTSIRLSIEES